MSAMSNQRPMTSEEYQRLLADTIDPTEYRDSLWPATHFVAQLVIVVCVFVEVGLRWDALAWYWRVAALPVAGNCVATLAFIGHEAGHGASRFGPGWMRRIVIHLGWSFSLFATATTTRKAHNALHHKLENTWQDPDRRMTVHELRHKGVDRIAPWLVPNSRHPISSGMVGFAFTVFSYHNSILWHSLFRTGELYDLALNGRQRRRALLEFVSNVTLYLLLWSCAGFRWEMLAFFIASYFWAASTAGVYVVTNHLLSGMSDAERRDPLASTVSLRVPRWLDFLHLNFSHHVEHHLYPTASYLLLPKIRRALRARFGDRYHELDCLEGLRTVLSLPMGLVGHNQVADPDGANTRTLPFPSYVDDPLPDPVARPRTTEAS